MPARSLRYCTYPGCPERVEQGRCKAHQREHYRHQDRNRRSTEHRWVYASVAWRRLREVILSASPICVSCGREWATEVDHIVPMALGGKPFDADNLQPLCRSCHSSKTMSEINDANRRIR